MLGLEPRAGRCSRVKHQHPRLKALLVWGRRHRNAPQRWKSVKWLWVSSESGVWASASGNKKGRGWCKAQRVGEKPDFTGLWIRVLLTKQRGILLWSYFHHLNLQYLYVCNKVIMKTMLNLCPSPLWESTVKSNIKNPNCKALFYCLFSTFLTLNCLDLWNPTDPTIVSSV